VFGLQNTLPLMNVSVFKSSRKNNTLNSSATKLLSKLMVSHEHNTIHALLIGTSYQNISYRHHTETIDTLHVIHSYGLAKSCIILAGMVSHSIV